MLLNIATVTSTDLQSIGEQFASNMFMNPDECLMCTYMWINMMLSTIWGLMTGQVSVNEMAGPVMIAKIAGETAGVGFSALIGLMAFLSVNLGLINILPIPGLDGGQVIIALVEGIMGQELSLKVKMGIQQVGILFLLFLFITIMVNDITRLF